MAAASFAIELPTNRQSRYFDGPAPNIYDPNYIPVLNGADLRVDFSQPSFSALPSIPTPHQNESQTSLKRSKSALAPETVVQSHVGQRLPQRPAPTRWATPQEIGSSHQPDSRDDARSSATSTDHTPPFSDTSTSSGPTTTLEEHVFVIPGNTVPKMEEIQFPTVPASARSSISSTNKSSVPTSRYNKKSPSIPTLPPTILQKAQSPLGIRMSPEHQTFESARSTPALPQTPDIPAASPALSTPRLQASKSSASERRARALHSHPSNVSLKSRRNSIVDETDELPLMAPTHPIESRASSTRSRTQSICNSTQPTPAPDAPLPDLPAGAKRPPTREREKTLDKPFPSLPPVHTPTPSPLGKSQNDHVEMAEFMTTQKTTVFRRFDEVHVRLLLHLQDEISLLEKALKEAEGAGSNKPDNTTNRANIMRELRKVLAEYDHLFANWSSMQANKATPEAKERLEKWLQSPSLETGKMSKEAFEDLQWLQNSPDLSSVSIDPEKQHHRSKTSDSSLKGSMSGGAGIGGGFLALFGCASRRK